MGTHLSIHKSGKITYTAKDGTRVNTTQSALDQLAGPDYVDKVVKAAKGF